MVAKNYDKTILSPTHRGATHQKLTCIFDYLPINPKVRKGALMIRIGQNEFQIKKVNKQKNRS